MVRLTRGVCRATPRLFAIASAAVTTPRAIRPCPPSFSLANTKTVSPSAICLPPYIVFCAVNVSVFARGSQTSALIANVMLLPPAPNEYRYSSSWPGLSRPSTSFLLLRWEDVDARDEPGHDELSYGRRFHWLLFTRRPFE